VNANRSRLNWGVFLIVLGAIPLAVEVGLIDRTVTGQVVGLWPIVLIALGIGIMLRFGPAHFAGGLLVAATFGLIGGALIAGGSPGLSGTCVGSVKPSDPSVTRSGGVCLQLEQWGLFGWVIRGQTYTESDLADLIAAFAAAAGRDAPEPGKGERAVGLNGERSAEIALVVRGDDEHVVGADRVVGGGRHARFLLRRGHDRREADQYRDQYRDEKASTARPRLRAVPYMFSTLEITFL